jgi:hypothetical protein
MIVAKEPQGKEATSCMSLWKLENEDQRKGLAIRTGATHSFRLRHLATSFYLEMRPVQTDGGGVGEQDPLQAPTRMELRTTTNLSHSSVFSLISESSVDDSDPSGGKVDNMCRLA